MRAVGQDHQPVGLLWLPSDPVGRSRQHVERVTADVPRLIGNQCSQHAHQHHRTPQRAQSESPSLTGLVIESPAAALSGRVRMNASQNSTIVLMLVK